MATFTEDFTRMRQEFDQSQSDRQAFCEHITQDCAERTERNQQSLKELRQQDAERSNRDRQWLEEMGNQLRSDLADFAGDLAAGGKIFRGG